MKKLLDIIYNRTDFVLFNGYVKLSSLITHVNSDNINNYVFCPKVYDEVEELINYGSEISIKPNEEELYKSGFYIPTNNDTIVGLMIRLEHASSPIAQKEVYLVHKSGVLLGFLSQPKIFDPMVDFDGANLDEYVNDEILNNFIKTFDIFIDKMNKDVVSIVRINDLQKPLIELELF